VDNQFPLTRRYRLSGLTGTAVVAVCAVFAIAAPAARRRIIIEVDGSTGAYADDCDPKLRRHGVTQTRIRR
jgi:hypothetical protein